MINAYSVLKMCDMADPRRSDDSFHERQFIVIRAGKNVIGSWSSNPGCNPDGFLSRW